MCLERMTTARHIVPNLDFLRTCLQSESDVDGGVFDIGKIEYFLIVGSAVGVNNGRPSFHKLQGTDDFLARRLHGYACRTNVVYQLTGIAADMCLVGYQQRAIGHAVRSGDAALMNLDPVFQGIACAYVPVKMVYAIRQTTGNGLDGHVVAKEHKDIGCCLSLTEHYHGTSRLLPHWLHLSP